MTRGPVSRLTVTDDLDQDSAWIHELDPESVSVIRGYRKSSGKEKIVSSVRVMTENPPLKPWRAIKSQYSYAVAVDTSTDIVGERRLSATFIRAIPKALAECRDGEEIPCVTLGAYLILDVIDGVNPECVGWDFVIAKHVLPGKFSASDRVALIVDSELGKLARLNARKEPYYMGKTLPPLVSLVYASDGSADAVPNALIRQCDRGAKRVLEFVRENGIPSPLTLSEDETYSSWIQVPVRTRTGNHQE